MNKKEVVEILKQVSTFYGNKFKVDDAQGVLNAWHTILADYDFAVIQANLIDYVKRNKFAPSVADLIAIEPKKDRAIPNPDETQAMFDRWEEKKVVADKAVADMELAKIREALGITRGEQ